MSSRRKSGRASNKVSYAETVAQLDDGDEEEVELDEETAAAKKKRISDELKKERLSARKRENDDVDYGKAPKKAKNAKSKKKAFKDAGKLSNIIDMPSDILAMIFSSLDPLDLLKLSRTNKMLHQFLREQTSIWIQCRQNLVLWIPKANVSHAHSLLDSDDEEGSVERYEPLYVPSKPPNLTESAWTRLLFDKSCFDCGNSKKRFYENFSLQVRFCHTCLPGKLLNRNKMLAVLEEELGKKKVEQAVFDILPICEPSSSSICSSSSSSRTASA